MIRVPPLAPVASLVEAVLQDVLQDVVGRLHVPERLPRLRDVHQDLKGRRNMYLNAMVNNSLVLKPTLLTSLYRLQRTMQK